MVKYNILLCERFKDRNVEQVFDNITIEKDSNTNFNIMTLMSIEDENDFSAILYYFIFRNEIETDGTRQGRCVGAKLVEENFGSKKNVNRIAGFPVSDISFDSSGEYVVEVYCYNEIPFDKENTKEDYKKVLQEGELVAKYNFNVELIK